MLCERASRVVIRSSYYDSRYLEVPETRVESVAQ